MTQLELVCECTMPKKGSQCYELLMAMKQGVRLTIWNAMTVYHCGALHQRIGDLRDMGWPIQRRLINTEGNAPVAEFWMDRA